VILAFFGAGAAIPLVAIALASRSGFKRIQGSVLANADRLKAGFAVVIAVIGIAILTGADKWLEARVTSILPDAWVNLTVGL
jgi:cytochrome c biogenesis protein CcdA